MRGSYRILFISWLSLFSIGGVGRVPRGLVPEVLHSQSPNVSVVLGVAIVSHKFPAGFSVVRRMESNWLLLFPAIIFGVVCLGSFFVIPMLSGTAASLIFGIAAGVFIHIAMDFLPECDRGDIYEVVEESEEEHHVLDHLRYHALGSVVVGSAVVIGLWAIVL